MSNPEADKIKILVENRKVRFNYHIIESFEAGLVLTGAEIKSLRNGGGNLADSYVRPIREELFLLGAHIQPYVFTKDKDPDPTRTRKLLLNRAEIDKLSARVAQKGLTIVPLKLYLKKGRAKLEIGLAKGKNAPDKRSSVREREINRELRRDYKLG